MSRPALCRTVRALNAATMLCLAACDNSSPAAPTPAPAVQAIVPEPQQKADAELSSRVKAALARDPGLQSFAIDVTASHGVVSLFGTAPSRAARDRAGKTAAQVEAVTSVQNNLAIVAGS